MSAQGRSADRSLWQAPIRVPLRRSRMVRRLHLCAWGCVLLALTLVPPGVALCWLVVALPVEFQHWRRNRRRAHWSLLSVRDGNWYLGRPGLEPRRAVLRPGAWLHPLLTVLEFHSAGERLSLVLCRDSLPAADLRHLRARLLLSRPPRRTVAGSTSALSR